MRAGLAQGYIMTKLSYRTLPARLGAWLLVSCLIAVPSFSLADDQVGGSRAAGMGGAGLALPLDIAQNHRLNPAMLGFATARLSFQYPSFGYHLDGLSLSDIKNKFGDLGTSGVDRNKLIAVAQELGGGQKTLGVDATLGVEYGGFSLDGDGSVNITTVPNQALINDSKAGVLSNLNDQLDAFGITDYEIGLSYGKMLQTTTGNLSVGGTVKYVKAYYSHQYVSGETITTGSGSVVAAPEMNGANDISQSSAGMDAGLLFSAGKNANVYYGMTITNLIEPNIGFARYVPVTDPETGATTEVRGAEVNPFQRSVNLGVGGVVDGKILLAADMYDVGNATGNSELRLGAEYAIAHGFAVRAGYNSATGFTVGFSVLGINFAYAANSQLSVSLGVKF